MEKGKAQERHMLRREVKRKNGLFGNIDKELTKMNMEQRIVTEDEVFLTLFADLLIRLYRDKAPDLALELVRITSIEVDRKEFYQ